MAAGILIEDGLGLLLLESGDLILLESDTGGGPEGQILLAGAG